MIMKAMMAVKLIFKNNENYLFYYFIQFIIEFFHFILLIILFLFYNTEFIKFL